MWIWIAAAVGVVFGLPLVIGLLLPKRFGSTVTRELPYPPEDVWRALNDYERHPMTGSSRRRTERIGDVGPGSAWREDMGTSVVTVRTAAAEPNRRLVRELEDSVVPMRSRWEYRLEPSGGGTRVSVSEEGVVESGSWHVPFFRIMVRVMKGRGIQAQLDALDRTLRTRA